MTEPAQQLLPTRTVAGAEHELGRVLRRGELDEGGCDIGARHFVELTADVLEQLALLIEQLGRRAGEPLVAGHVHTEQFTMGTLGDAREPAGSTPRCQESR